MANLRRTAPASINERIIDWYRATVPNDRRQESRTAGPTLHERCRESMIAGITAGKFTLKAGLVIAASGAGTGLRSW